MTRIAIVKKEKCQPTDCGNFLCIGLCPINRSMQDCIVKDEETKKVLINEETCIGCGICVNRCPFDAISIINLPDELNDKIVHQYDRNGFHLYNIPTPIFGKVIGVLGRNGIGKSTAMKVLAGMLKPNFGDWEATEKQDEKSSAEVYKELINFFKGTEAQGYFEKVAKGEIKLAYKPQQVEDIAIAFKGKPVRELLEKVNETGKFDEIVKALSLEKFLDNHIDKISGGELQRVAIAATVLKEADLYMFDEPTSYLDIKQRIKVSKFIQDLANETTAVMVIEHDLIILDYMTDMIHIMYGREGEYGVTSQLLSTKNGINTYLSGFLRESNMRFRDSAIKFEQKTPVELTEIHKLTSWTEITKQLGHFHLTANPGELYKKQVIGILGENGIGKTSFVKILADVIKADSGKIENNLKVAYKPQYIEADDTPVALAIATAVKKFETQIVSPLGLKPLLNRTLNQLSGGELQRVSIAKCLSQEVDLYLLDEPSAYLDVEQRLIVSKVIRERMEQTGKTSLIVDHDLLFIDYLSDGLVVVDGEPAVKGTVNGPFSMTEGMNRFLEDLGLTFRRDEETKRPRANKPESQMDRKQKQENKLYYS